MNEKSKTDECEYGVAYYAESGDTWVFAMPGNLNYCKKVLKKWQVNGIPGESDNYFIVRRSGTEWERVEDE